MPDSLPAGYVRVKVGGARVTALANSVESIRSIVARSGTIHGYASTDPSGKPLRGRGISWAFDTGRERWVVRQYRRGGAVAKVLRDRYLRLLRTRPARELRASIALRERGIRTPEVIATVLYPAVAFYRAEIVTRWIPDSEDLAAVTFGPDLHSAAERAAAWAAAGRLLHSVFAKAVIHPDLNLRNILIAHGEDPPTAWLIDLDRCRVRDVLPAEARRTMLERFHRSRRKLERGFRRPVDAASLAAFQDALNG